MENNLVEQLLLSVLKGATEDTIVHLNYVAGRQPTHRAICEAEMAADWGKAPTQFVGHFRGLRRTKKGELLLTLWVHNRGEAGAYRAFNPTLGFIRNIRVVNA